MTEEQVFMAALDLPDRAGRIAYLDEACGQDCQLRRQVEELLAAHERSGEFLDEPAAEQMAARPHEVGDETIGLTAESDGKAMAADKKTDASAHPGDNDEELHFLTPSTRPDSLGRLGHYEMLQVLGKGGFGIVFRAFDDILQRVVAVKVMAPQLAATSPARKRFLREARSSAAVRHENVVQVYEVGEQPLPYLTMEFIPGETLQQKLNRCGPLDVPEVLRIGRQVAEGLAAAHTCDLIHRDIKPGNILLEGGSYKAKITDFGLARAADDASISQSGIIAGTPMFMAPEQALGLKIDQRADLFSLGSVLYQMASGRPPFRATGTVAVLKRVAEDTPRDIREIIPETPQWLCNIIAKLHAKNPDERFQSAREVADVLTDCEQQLKAHSALKDYSHIPGGAPRRPRRRGWVAAAAVLLLSVSALAVTELAGVTHLFRGRQATTTSIQAGPEPTPAALGTDWLRETASCAGHKGPVHGVIFGHEGKFLASAGADKSVRIWSPDQGNALRSLEFQCADDGAVAVVGSLLVAGGQDHAFTGWDVNTWQKAFAFVDHPGWAVRTLAAHRTGFLSCGKNDGSFHFWDPVGKSGGGRYTTGRSMPWSAVVRPDGERIVVGLDSGKIDFLDASKISTEDYKPEALTGHTGAVRALAYSPDGTVLASGGVDRSIKLWNGEDGKELAALIGHEGAVLALVYSSDGKYLVSGGADRTVRLWDVVARKPAGAPLTLSATVNALAWSAEGRTLATGCDDGSVKLWQIKLPASPVPLTKQEPLPPTFKNGIGMEFVRVPKGKAWLGGSKDKLGDKEVEIPADFYLGKYEVTQEEWEKVMGANPSHFSRSGGGKDAVKDISDADLKRFPVENVSWDQCEIFVEKLNRLEKETGWVYRLPKEAEWEYACRGGPMSDKLDSAFEYYFAKPMNTLLPDLLNFGKRLNRTCKVGSYEANRLGIFDMHGNVWEWCDDAQTPRISRAGAWDSPSWHCGAAQTLPIQWNRLNSLGLRLARVPSGAPSPEVKTPPVAIAPFTDADVQRIASLPAAEQVEEVRKELVRRNPGFDGQVKHKTEDGVVTEFRIVSDKVTDLTPLKGMNLAGLTRLILNDTKVGDVGLAHFKECKNLTYLDLIGTHLSDAGLVHFQNCKALMHLNLASTNVSDAGLIHFKDCKNLTYLHLDHMQVGDAGLAHFKDCKNLDSLNLSCTRVSDAGLIHFKDCRNLSKLYLFDTSVSDAGLANFKGMPLKHLMIYETGITDLTPLQGMPLEDLRLSPKNITRGLEILRDMKSLKTIGIQWKRYKGWPAAEFWERYDKGEFKE